MSLASPEPSPFVESKNYSVHWDALRGLALVIMTIVHTFPALEPGIKDFTKIFAITSPCMDLIFVISGFLITRSCCRQMIGQNAETKKVMKIFALRRMLRTWPLYYLFVIVCFLVPVYIFGPITKQLSSYLTFTMNIPIELRTIGDLRLLHLWSTCLEEWCYFIFLIFCIPFMRTKYANWIFIGFAMASLIGRILLVQKNGGPLTDAEYITQIHASTYLRWDGFWWGCLLGRWSFSNDITNVSQKVSMLAAAFLVPALYIFIYNNDTATFYNLRDILNPIIGTFVSVCLLYGFKLIPEKWVRRSGLPAFGLRTYTIYLVHFVLMTTFVHYSRKFGWFEIKSAVEITCTYAFLIASSFLIFEIFERPILKILKTRLRLGSVK